MKTLTTMVAVGAAFWSSTVSGKPMSQQRLEKLLVPPVVPMAELSAASYAAACDGLLEAVPKGATLDAQAQAVFADGALAAASAKKTAAATAAIAFCQKPLKLDSSGAFKNPAPNLKILQYLKTTQKRKEFLNLPEGFETEQVFLPFNLPVTGVASGFQDALVRGLAAFIEARAKSELAAAFAKRFHEALCPTKTSTALDGPDLFRRTCSLVATVDDFYETPVSWGALRRTLQEDLERLPAFLAAELYARIPNTNLKEVVLAGTSVAYWVAEGATAADVFASFASHYGPSRHSARKLPGTVCGDRDAECALFLTGLAVQVVDPDGAMKHAAAVSKRSSLYGKLVGRLLVEALDANEVLKPHMTDLRRRAGPIGADIAKVGRSLDQLTRASKKLVAMRGKSQMGVPITTVGERLHQLERVTEATMPALGALPEVVDAVLPKRCGVDLKKLVDTAQKIGEPMLGALHAAREGDYVGVFVQANLVVPQLHQAGFKEIRLPKSVTKYGAFMAELASADTPEAVRAAIENVAAPVGSWKLKRRACRLTLSFSALAGFSAGADILAGSKLPNLVGGYGALFAPIGFDVNFGLDDKNSLGLFFSVLDVGALLNGRNSSTNEVDASMELARDAEVADPMDVVSAEVESLPSYELEQFLSPGFYLVWGIWDTPAVFGIGAAFKPQVRTVNLLDAANAEIGQPITANAIQVGAVLAIDVTILPF